MFPPIMAMAAAHRAMMRRQAVQALPNYAAAWGSFGVAPVATMSVYPGSRPMAAGVPDTDAPDDVHWTVILREAE